MPSPVTTDLPRPKSWDEFEDITAAILKVRWKTPNVTRNGRSGQAQNGVDIYGRARHLDDKYAGAQCKKLSDSISWKTIVEAVNEAEDFEPKLAEFYVATTAPRDTEIQKLARMLTEERRQIGKYPVEVLFWEDICLDLVGDKTLLATFFPAWAKLTDSEQVPTIDLKWIDDEGTKIDGALAITAPPTNLIDIAMEFAPYGEKEIAELQACSPEELAKALAYNAAVERVLVDEDLKKTWLKSRARERFKKGILYGLSVGVDVAEARDIWVTLTLPPEIEVYEPGRAPMRVVGPDLPGIPSLPIAEQRAKVRMPALLDAYGDRMKDPFDQLHVHARENLRVPMARLDPISVKGNKVHIRIPRLAQRRSMHYAGKYDGLVLVPIVESGRFTAHWRADAANLPSPIEGQLDLEIMPSPEGRMRIRRPYVGPTIKVAVKRFPSARSSSQ